MAASGKPSDSEQVTSFITDLGLALGHTVETIRQLILGTDPDIGERIKWNHPSFYYTGDMRDFAPKTYAREIAVFNLHKGRILLVFPSGAKINDPSELLEGDYKDGRRTILFKDAEDVAAKKTALQQVVKEWMRVTTRDT